MLMMAKTRIIEKIDQVANTMKDLALKIHANPELGFKEEKAVQWLGDFLQSEGFHIEIGLGGLDTAFKAWKTTGNGPNITYLAEYDALPDLGHGCGHNLIGVASCGAAVGLVEALANFKGTVTVLGTPAEETSGGKVTLVKQGIFDDVDVAMMIHPADRTVVNTASLAMEALQFDYYGKPSHAASAPHKGVNALEGLIQLFNNINSLRASLRDGVRINGIITEGGKVPNIIPDFAQGQFYVRALTKKYLNEVVDKVKKCAEAAALATGTKVKITNFEVSYDNMVTNNRLAECFTKNIKQLGIEDIEENRAGMGSLDMGNVSQVVPAIHPFIQIGDKGLTAHTEEFCRASAELQALEAMIKGAKALAVTGFDVLSQPKLLREIKSEINNLKKNI